ncbi:hypothetical protein TH5N_18460 [Tetragenococcus halophilus]|nr:hypothetical protein TH3N_18240 [Tetragenococcus halophilus]GEQ40968.1 hypothetical protein TH5N_18460 [Tetragenococcus halophilus]GEQ43202.1 hypothetical protein TH6N_18280 [Tetragenococcus halophilus]GEQ45488.1 hypothetical protein TH8N_18580 [Tetragenococcus halophilus]GEQ47748.1 hypothetical protein TH9N_18610 [Tetragenococcus halophilus]
MTFSNVDSFRKKSLKKCVQNIDVNPGLPFITKRYNQETRELLLQLNEQDQSVTFRSIKNGTQISSIT